MVEEEEVMLSVLLFVGQEDTYRKKNLIETLRCISNQTFKDYEVILVEQDFGDKEIYKYGVYEMFKLNVDRYINVRNTLPTFYDAWNPSWLLNIGAKRANGEKILQLDADMMFDTDFFKRIHDSDMKTFICWDQLYRMNEDGTKLFLESKSFSEFVSEFNKDIGKYLDMYLHSGRPIAIKPNLRGAAGGVICFDREFYLKELGGRNERFMYWGGTDNEIAYRWSALLGGFFTMNYTLYHLYHPHNKRKFELRHKLLAETVSNPMVMCKRILKSEIGNMENPTLFEVEY